MPTGSSIPAESNPTTEAAEATLRGERAAGWLRAPLIVAALLAVPVIVVQESDLGGFWKPLAGVLDWCVALLTGALAQRFLYGGVEGVAPEAAPGEAETTRKLDELSHQIAGIQKTLGERRG